MTILELMQLLNTDIGNIGSTTTINPAPAVPEPKTAPEPEPVSVAVAEQYEGPQQYGGLENLLKQMFAGQQASTAAVTKLTNAIQAAQIGTGIQSQPAVTADAATARIINPTYKEGSK